MLVIIIWSLIGLINLINERLSIMTRLVILAVCFVIVIQQLELMGVVK